MIQADVVLQDERKKFMKHRDKIGGTRTGGKGEQIRSARWRHHTRSRKT